MIADCVLTGAAAGVAGAAEEEEAVAGVGAAEEFAGPGVLEGALGAETAADVAGIDGGALGCAAGAGAAARLACRLLYSPLA